MPSGWPGWRWRFIPAGAGNSFSPCRRMLRRSVHPRGGGELTAWTGTMEEAFGSSPRGRGTPTATAQADRPERFIPAGAGNSPYGSLSSRRARVHPRGGGELRWPQGYPPLHPGSSPRGRGTLPAGRVCGSGGRFIPAGAGNSNDRSSFSGRAAVHPRGGGELDRPAAVVLRLRGSSPRGRGTLKRGPPFRYGKRFIPAGAGNSWPPETPWEQRPVHPRGGGELAEGATFAGGVAPGPIGSSPRGRGTRIRHQTSTIRRRFIPAGAGNSSGQSA